MLNATKTTKCLNVSRRVLDRMTTTEYAYKLDNTAPIVRHS